MRAFLCIFAALASLPAWALPECLPGIPENPPPVVEPAAPSSGLVIVHLNEAPLLRSEQRTLDRLAKRLGAHIAPGEGERALVLKRFLETPDPAERARLPLESTLGPYSLLLVIRYAPPRDKVAQRPLGFGLLKSTAPHEVLWVSGLGLAEDGLRHLAGLVKELLK